jgi:hypothetical protein
MFTFAVFFADFSADFSADFWFLALLSPDRRRSEFPTTFASKM